MLTGAEIDLEIMRASALLNSDPAAAARKASAILHAAPGHAAARLLLASACRRFGDSTAAIRALEALLDAEPRSPILLLELGRCYAASGRHPEATAALERAVAIDERLADGWRELAAQRFLAGDTLGGDQAYGRYARLAPPPPELRDALAALADQRLDSAEAMLKQRLSQAPDDALALHRLAAIASARGNFIEAERLLRQCLQLAPGFAAARFDLANELHSIYRHTEALPLVERLLASDPDNSSYRNLKAQSLRMLDRNAEAVALMREAVARHPDDARSLLLYGHVLREVGEQAAAIEAYRRALAIQPDMGEAWWSLANLKTVSFSDQDRGQMQERLAHSASSGSSRVSLEFALGKACEDAGEYEPAFRHYAHGNALHRATVYYDSQAPQAALERSQALYSARFFGERQGWGSERADPIFIVGMPRSGSTLLEQILASHSQIEGTRELPDLPGMVQELILQTNPAGGSNYPDPVATLGRQEIDAYAARYLRQTAEYRKLGRPRFVDKMLVNFANVGLIQLMLPNAVIIDARRHPMATCFSCYKQLFARGLSFAYQQQELGQFYRVYAELMAHMDEVLPGRVYPVYYEQLVAEPERTIRDLLAHCGLPFEPGCLRFHETRRVVNTISSEQVRRPLNAGSIGQWRHFEPWLGELAAALGDLPVRYPGGR